MTDTQLFKIKKRSASPISSVKTARESELQELFETNLENLLGIRFVARQFRMENYSADTAGLDESNSPVIIEYKLKGSKSLISQGAHYITLLKKYKEKFELKMITETNIKIDGKINWNTPRLLCIAANFADSDKSVINQVGYRIERIRYQRFEDDLLLLEFLDTSAKKIYSKSRKVKENNNKRKASANIAMSTKTEALYNNLRQFMESLGDDVQEHHLQHYFAFKRLRSFACVIFRSKKNMMLIYLNLDPKKINISEKFIRDVKNINHNGQGDVEITISSNADIERAKKYIKMAYNQS